MPQFDSLGDYLKKSQGNDIMMSFKLLDTILSPNKLPVEARNRRKWWENTNETPQGAAWMQSGWEVMNVNLIHGEVTFSRISTSQQGSSGRVVFPETPRPKP
jgi:hypothetical protein